MSRVLALAAILAAGPPVRLSAQCPDGTPPPCGRAAATARTNPNSVAVLYFDNISRDTSDAYIAEGLTEELIARLGQIERLQIKSRNAVRRYRGAAAADPTAVGHALGVAHLVSGSVRRSGDRLRVTVELTRVANGVRVWGDTYERSSADLMAVEADIAQAIAVGVSGRLAPTERRSLAARPTVNPEAYDHFLRGNYAFAPRAPAGVRRAISEYENAVRIDPAFAQAHARIGLAYVVYYDWGWTFPGVGPESLLALGAAATARALRLDSLSADGWMVDALLQMYLHPTTIQGSVPAFERAIAIDPRNAELWHHYASALAVLGRDSGAVAAFRRALELEPGRAITVENLAWLLAAVGRRAEAERLVDSGLVADPEAYYLHSDRASFALMRGDTARARTAAAAAVATRPADFPYTTEPLVAALEAIGGDTAASRSRMGRLATLLSDSQPLQYFIGYSMALGYVRIGDRDLALTTLERIRPRSLLLGYTLRDPALDPIRSDPRFQRLVGDTRPPAR